MIAIPQVQAIDVTSPRIPTDNAPDLTDQDLMDPEVVGCLVGHRADHVCLCRP